MMFENIAMRDVPRATDLINQGRVAAGNRERETLRDINRQLSPLFPGTEEERSKSYGSGSSLMPERNLQAENMLRRHLANPFLVLSLLPDADIDQVERQGVRKF